MGAHRAAERRVLASKNALTLARLLADRATNGQLTVPRADLLAAWLELYPEDGAPRRHPQIGRSGTIAHDRVFHALRDLEKLELVRRGHTGSGEHTVIVVDLIGLRALVA